MSRPILSLKRKKPVVKEAVPVISQITKKKKKKIPTPKIVKRLVHILTPEEVEANRLIRIEKTFNWLSITFPALFSEREPVAPKPLAIKIHKELKALYKQASKEVKAEMSYRDVALYLERWVQRREYQEACSVPGAPRFNLNGEMTGNVTEKEAGFSVTLLQNKVSSLP